MHLIDVTLADEDTYSKVVFAVADVEVGGAEILSNNLVKADCLTIA